MGHACTCNEGSSSTPCGQGLCPPGSACVDSSFGPACNECGFAGEVCCSTFPQCWDDELGVDGGLHCRNGVCAFSPLPKPEAGPHDALAVDACANLMSCEQCVFGYVPVTENPAPVTSNVCSASELQAYISACFSSTGSQAACDTWSAADSGACGACITSPSGPVAQDTLNYGGCIDLTLGTVAKEKSSGGSGSCGDVYAAEEGCLNYVCGGCSPYATTFQDCWTSAGTACASYGELEYSSAVCAPLQNNNVAPNCFPGSDAALLAFFNVFCGTGP